MKLSVREARAQFAAALAAVENGERVTITKNGKAVAELGPPPVAVESGSRLDRMRAASKALGLDKYKPEELWPPEFDEPAFSREVLRLGDDWDPTR